MATKNKLSIWLPAAAAVCLIAVGIAFISRHGSPVDGIYIANGGVDCFEIIKQDGHYAVKRVTINKTWANFPYTPENTAVYEDKNRLWIQEVDPKQSNLKERMKAVFNIENEYDHTDIMLLRASVARGDWDLIGVGQTKAVRSLKGDELKSRVPSYFHRIDDPRVVQVFDLLGEGERPREALKVADALLAAYPGDEFVKIMLLKTELMAGDNARFLADVEKFSALAESKNNRVAFNYELAKQQAFGLQMTAAGRNAVPVGEELLAETTDLPHLLSLYPKFLACDAWVVPLSQLKCPPLEVSGNLIHIQRRARLAAQSVLLMLLQGKTGEAMTLAVSIHREGALLKQSPHSLDKVIGIRVCHIADRVLLECALNACLTESDFTRLCDLFENQMNLREFLKLEEYGAFPKEIMEAHKGSTQAELPTRFNVEWMEFQLARMAAAARHYQLRHGELPKNAADFSIWPRGLADDAFTTGGKLRLISSKDELAIYSVGPDRTHEKADTLYDPTNGAISGGDIVVRIPRERERTYSEAGLRASTVADVERQFPRGLVTDYYSTTKGKPLSISPTKPVYIYSFGPDMDEPGNQEKPGLLDSDEEIENKNHVPMNGQDGFPEVMYDPTNGTFSSGDIWIQLPPLDAK